MTDVNRALVPDNWSLVRERALTTALDFVRKDGILNTRVSAEERSCRETAESESGNLIPCFTGSQWSSRKRRVTKPRPEFSKTSVAAESEFAEGMRALHRAVQLAEICNSQVC